MRLLNKKFARKTAAAALVLAAGKGTRLQTEGIDLPKVMRQADGHPLLYYVLRGLSFLPPEDIILVVGWKKEKVLSAFPQYPHAVQETLNGTGGAVQYAAPLLEGFDGHLIVCCGDAPMMRQETFQSLVDTHLKEGNACTMLSARLDEGGSYGRVLREPDGTIVICEVKTRSQGMLQRPAAAVDPAKQHRLICAAQGYLQQTGQSEEPVRFDVAEVVPLDSGRWMVHIIKGAFLCET